MYTLLIFFSLVNARSDWAGVPVNAALATTTIASFTDEAACNMAARQVEAKFAGITRTICVKVK